MYFSAEFMSLTTVLYVRLLVNIAAWDCHDTVHLSGAFKNYFIEVGLENCIARKQFALINSSNGMETRRQVKASSNTLPSPIQSSTVITSKKGGRQDKSRDKISTES